jgi:hypothetical protein
MNGFIEFILRTAGLPEATLADLEKEMPALARIVAAAKQLEPIFNKPQTLAKHIEQATPILKAAYPDVIAAAPTVEELVEFISSKSG